MVNRSFCLGLLSYLIVSSVFTLANAQKTPPATPTAKTETKATNAVNPANAKSASAPTPNTSKQSEKPAPTIAAKEAPAPKVAPPVLLELKTGKDMYRPSQDIMVKAELWATKPVTLCVYPDKPEASFAVDVYRAGYGKLEAPPAVVQLNRQDEAQMQQVKLEAGQVHRMLFNVKKLVPMPPVFWKTGEYRMQVKYFLCGKGDQVEMTVPSHGPVHFLVLE